MPARTDHEQLRAARFVDEDRRGRALRVVIKGAADLPHVLAKALDGLGGPARGGRGIIQVEVDPVEWPS